MKVRFKEKIGDHTIIKIVTDAAVDSVKTMRKIEPMKKSGMSKQDIKRLYMENLVYADYGAEGELIGDAEGEADQRRLEARGENRLLLDNGEYIADHRNVEFWKKENGQWIKERIEKLGVSLPVGAVLPDKLTTEQNKEITDQQEKKRIGALGLKEKAAELLSRIRSLAREASQKAEDAELLGETFNKKEWFEQKKAELEKAYK